MKTTQALARMTLAVEHLPEPSRSMALAELWWSARRTLEVVDGGLDWA